MQVLRGSTVKADLMIVESVETTVKSDLWTLYVVSKGTDLSKLGKAVKLLNATKPADLADAEVIRSSKVVIVDEKTLSVFGAVSLIAERVLRL